MLGESVSASRGSARRRASARASASPDEGDAARRLLLLLLPRTPGRPLSPSRRGGRGSRCACAERECALCCTAPGQRTALGVGAAARGRVPVGSRCCSARATRARLRSGQHRDPEPHRAGSGPAEGLGCDPGDQGCVLASVPVPWGYPEKQGQKVASWKSFCYVMPSCS